MVLGKSNPNFTNEMIDSEPTDLIWRTGPWNLFHESVGSVLRSSQHPLHISKVKKILKITRKGREKKPENVLRWLNKCTIYLHFSSVLSLQKGCTSADLKVKLSISLRWPTTSEKDIAGRAVEVEPSCQCCVTFCSCVTYGSRAAVWQNGIWHGSVYEAKVCHWIPRCRKNCIHWHSSTLAECLWRPGSGYEHREAVGGKTLWNSGSPPLAQILQAQHAVTCSWLAKMCSKAWRLCWNIVFCSW